MEQNKESQTKKILKLLREKGEATNFELNRICYRYGARIYELRQDGHAIVSDHVKGSLWRFILKEDEE